MSKRGCTVPRTICVLLISMLCFYRITAEDAADTAEAAYNKAIADAKAKYDADTKAAKDQYAATLKDLVKAAAGKGDFNLAQKAIEKAKAIEFAPRIETKTVATVDTPNEKNSRKSPTPAEINMEDGDHSMRQRRYQDAINSYMLVLKERPGDTRAMDLIEQAKEALRTGDSSKINIPPKAEMKPEELTVKKTANDGKYVFFSDGSMWNFGSETVTKTWKSGDTVKRLGTPEDGFQKFQGPDGNIGKAKEEK